MGIAFDSAPDRPEHIEAILNGLDRYNPETTTIFQDYVTQQCEDRTYDCYANLALLKLYQFNPHLTRDEPVTNILVKALTLARLNARLERCAYRDFWDLLDSDDLYADLVADVNGFEELMRVRIAVTVGQGCRAVERPVAEGWLNLRGQDFEAFVREICGWGVDDGGGGGGGRVVVPVNKENEAKGTVVREEVRFEQFGRVVRRAYEQPA
ncbi:hypothetical protein HO173_006253 [Letharia columbiana]|uniref:Eukaryotic translation initiation factor 3 subunit K n=1 Tax=Letharia columbiana TaxID=112416 RepID=A0A8H6FVI9_9LECA|nr:uncharacterized protein HO173_006253 [Letharia columbiana]KAF6235570.1 hypothetical protein HO173_006253 [Letharia columbiana]